jgi:hypothetical protein
MRLCFSSDIVNHQHVAAGPQRALIHHHSDRQEWRHRGGHSRHIGILSGMLLDASVRKATYERTVVLR